MPLPEYLGESKPLGHFVDHLNELSWSCCLYVRHTMRDIDLAIECFPSDFDYQQASEGEAEDFEASVTAAGFRPFLFRDQLQGIVDNLRRQRREYERSDLARAIDYYWKRDAFIVLRDDVA